MSTPKKFWSRKLRFCGLQTKEGPEITNSDFWTPTKKPKKMYSSSWEVVKKGRYIAVCYIPTGKWYVAHRYLDTDFWHVGSQEETIWTTYLMNLPATSDYSSGKEYEEDLNYNGFEW